MSERGRRRKGLEALVESALTSVGENFLNSLTLQLTEILGVKCAYLGSVSEDKHRLIKTVSIHAKGRTPKVREFGPTSTAFRQVLGRGAGIYPRGAQKRFPKDPLITELAAEGFVGVPLLDSHGNTNGVLAVLDSKPIDPPDHAMELLGTVAIRAGAELERLCREHAFRESEMRYRAVFNQTYQFMGVLDPSGTVVEVNQTSLDFVRAEHKEVVGQPFWKGPWWSHSTETQKEVRKCIADAAAGRITGADVIHYSHDGIARRIDFSVKPLRNDVGEVVCLVAEGRDVTERYLAEERLRKTLDEVETRVDERTGALQRQIAECRNVEGELQKATEDLKRRFEERTRDLRAQIVERDRMERQFIQAQKMEAVGQLTGGISHDFNNLLTIILGNLDWLSERVADDEKSSHLAEEAIKAARRGADLTQRLLTFSRKQDLRPELIKLPELISRFEPLLLRALRETIVFEKDFGKKLWSVLVDPGQLENAVMNLCINSRDAMPNGGTLNLRARNFVVNERFAENRTGMAIGDYVVLTVEDSGTGMTREVLQRACDPFFSTKEAGKGSGLGLSMVFGFARQSGGLVEMDSEVGRGSSVHLYLPRAANGETEKNGTSRALPAKGGSETILVVEDDHLVRNLIQGHLAALGYRTFNAGTAVEALSVLERGTAIDLVLTDIVMPGGMSGLDLSDAVKTRFDAVKTLCMSGYSHDEFARNEHASEDVVMLHKPFTKEDLASMLRTILDT